MDASERVSVSHKQWDKIVEEAEPGAEDKTAYQFSNGRTFKSGNGACEPEA